MKKDVSKITRGQLSVFQNPFVLKGPDPNVLGFECECCNLLLWIYFTTWLAITASTAHMAKTHFHLV
jgi:hypothetical protein